MISGLIHRKAKKLRRNIHIVKICQVLFKVAFPFENFMAHRTHEWGLLVAIVLHVIAKPTLRLIHFPASFTHKLSSSKGHTWNRISGAVVRTYKTCWQENNFEEAMDGQTLPKIPWKGLFKKFVLLRPSWPLNSNHKELLQPSPHLKIEKPEVSWRGDGKIFTRRATIGIEPQQ